MSFSENLIRLQAERGETNYRLAKEIGVSQTSIKSWKDGIRRPFPRHMTAIAKHYGVTVEELVKEDVVRCTVEATEEGE